MINFCTTGKVFYLQRFNAKSKTSDCLVRELLYADDADLVAHSLEDNIDCFANTCKWFGLTVSLDKTKVMFTPAPGEEYVELDIYVYGIRSKVAKSFVYLGTTLASDGFLDIETKEQISKTSSVAFVNLEDRVWWDWNTTIITKLAVYETCMLTSPLYASETWIL